MVYPAFDGPTRDARALGDLRLFEAIEVAQLDDLAVVVGELIECAGEIDTKVEATLGRLVCIFRELIRCAKLGRCVVSRSFRAVTREVGRDGEDPGFESARWVETRARSQRAQERFLKKLFGVGRVAGEPEQGSIKGTTEPVEQFSRRLLVAGEHLLRKMLIGQGVPSEAPFCGVVLSGGVSP